MLCLELRFTRCSDPALVPVSADSCLSAQSQSECCSGFDAGEKPSWTAKLLSKPELLCSKIREEAGELCQSLEENEGPDRAASEMADLLYHSMVLLNLQVAHPDSVVVWHAVCQGICSTLQPHGVALAPTRNVEVLPKLLQKRVAVYSRFVWCPCACIVSCMSLMDWICFATYRISQAWL